MNATSLCRSALAVVMGLLLLIFGYEARGQQSVNQQGRDFWIMMPAPGHSSSNDNEKGKVVAMTSLRGATATVVCYFTNSYNHCDSVVYTYSVPANGSVRHWIPLNQDATRNWELNVVKPVGIHVSATDTISVCMEIHDAKDGGFATVFPTEFLGTDYLVTGYQGHLDWHPYDAAINVLAVQDSTHITIVPSGQLDGCTAGNFTATLNKGEGVSVSLANQYSYFDGTRVVSDKPVAVFEGGQNSSIPFNTYYLDLTINQAIPTEYLGTRHLVVNSIYRSSDVVHVTASSSNCRVYVNGSYCATLQAFETYRFNIDTTGLAFVTTNKPVKVSHYHTSFNFDSTRGDPALTQVPPLHAMIEESSFTTMDYTILPNQPTVLNIVTPTAEVSGMRLDNVDISSQFQSATVATGFSYARIPISIGDHHLQNISGGFLAEQYASDSGQAQLTHIGCRGMRHFYEVDVNHRTYVDTVILCPGNDAQFDLQTTDSPRLVEWNFGDGVVDSGMSVSHLYQVGLYNFTVSVYLEGDDQPSRLIEGWVRMMEPDTSLEEMLVCQPLSWNALNITSGGFYSAVLTDRYGCDSLAQLSVTFFDGYFDTIRGQMCPNGSFEYWGREYVRFGDYDSLFVASDGCDSTATLHLSSYPVPMAQITLSDYEVDRFDNAIVATDATLDEVARQWWVNDITSGSGSSVEYLPGLFDYVVDFMLVVWNEYGCVDTAQEQCVVSVPEHLRQGNIWAPNAITPTRDGNQKFRIFGQNVSDLDVQIFNRNGQLVAQFDGLAGGWDATCKGILVPQGSYVWIARYRDTRYPLRRHTEKGTVTVIY